MSVDWPALVDDVRDRGGPALDPGSARPVAGGSINRAYRVEAATGPVFIKFNLPGQLAMFEAEAEGLLALDEAGGVRVPRVHAAGEAGGVSYLAMEWLDLGRGDSSTAEALGRGLARQHQVTAEAFGWHRDNTIGATPQINPHESDWARFFAEHRIAFQVRLAVESGFHELAALGDELVARIPDLLDGHSPSASLLHGDLWGGNHAATADGEPVIFDPAVYYGDREADIAMTRLFGGFSDRFYAAYEAEAPLPAGWERRTELYNLYHVLNHANLFGMGYAHQAEGMMEGLLAAVR